MRFAGEKLEQFTPGIGLDPSDLRYTPELPPPIPSDEYRRDNHILRPASGVTMLPNEEIGPSQGPNTPIKQYENGQYMPNAAEYPADEMQAGYNGGEIAMHPLLLPAHVIRGAVSGQPTADGTLPELRGQPDPFQMNNQIRPSDSDDQYMDIMKSGFV